MINTNFISDINSHLSASEGCSQFLSSIKKKGVDLEKMQHLYMDSFSKLFLNISNNCIEKWEADYERLPKIEIYSTQLKDIKRKIEKCKSADRAFRKQIFRWLRTSPEILLYQDCILFLPIGNGKLGSIWECHCCEGMEREMRRRFSHNLCREITASFPNKENHLTIASIGAGLCFNELEIHALVTEQKHIIDRWVIVDPTLFSKSVANFHTLIQWENPKVEVLTVEKTCESYFDDLENGLCTHLPDVFLFIDIDLHINSDHINAFASRMKHNCLFANFKKLAYDYYDAAEFIFVGNEL